MKPISLKIKGINSYVEEQNIDFSNLSSGSLFGIFGETGSGKTTILDCITLSIYGVCDRENLQNMINVNLKNAYIEFVFDMKHNDIVTRYFVKREYHIRPSGLKTEATVIDLNTNQTLADNSDSANDVLLKIIGIARKEFSKCIALPQNEFDRFLSDTALGRRRTIAKLFSLEQFGSSLNEKIRKRQERSALEKLNLEDKISTYGDLSDEKVNSAIKILNNYHKDKELLIKELDKLKDIKTSFENILAEKELLMDTQVQLTLKQSEKYEIEYLKKQVDYTKKYGEYVEINLKYSSLEKDIKKLNELLIINKHSLIKNEEMIENKTIKLNEIQSKIEQNKLQISASDVANTKYTFYDSKIKELIKNRDSLEEKVSKYTEDLLVLKESIEEYENILTELRQEYKIIDNLIVKNENLLDKLFKIDNIKHKNDFVNILSNLKNIISPDKLYEIKEYETYGEIKKLITHIQKYELQYRNEITKLTETNKELFDFGNTADEIQDNLENKNIELSKECKLIEQKLENSNKFITATNNKIEELNNSKSICINEIVRIEKEINNNLKEIELYKNIKPVSYFEQENMILNEKVKDLTEYINELYQDKQNNIVEIEINTTNLENVKLEFDVIKKQIKKKQFINVDDIEHTELILNQNQLKDAQSKIESYNIEIKLLNEKLDSLVSTTSKNNITNIDLENVNKDIALTEQKIIDIEVFISVNKFTIDIQKKNLEKLKLLQIDLEKCNKHIEMLKELNQITKNNAMIDYVAEEYMILITNLANKYVYQISKGKYLLAYDNEFCVIDNFNGSQKRSLRTLSGGEKFIISLSLALGLSQSISLSSNNAFNFFFIDEGFGNLSDTYIKKVLQSFDALIKLKFTIGFITHVEKMQIYTTHKLLVSKESNEKGTIIKQI